MMIRIAATCILTSGCVLNRITPDFIGLEWQNREDLVSENLLNEGNPPGIVSARKLTYEKHLFLSDTFYQTNRGEQELRYEYDVVRKDKFRDIQHLEGKPYFGLRFKESSQTNPSFDREQLDPRTRLFVREEINGGTYWVEYLVTRKGDRYLDIFGTEAVWENEKPHALDYQP